MNAKFLSILVVGAGLLPVGAPGQTSNPPAAEPSLAASVAVPAPAAPDQIIYAPQLPPVAALTAAAAAQGLGVRQIAQSDREVSVTCQLANGQVRTISYRLLSAISSTSSQPSVSVQTSMPDRRVIVIPAAEPEVIYVPDTTYYYDPHYWPSYWYPPVMVDFAFGWGWAYHGGGHYRGGHHGHFRGRH